MMVDQENGNRTAVVDLDRLKLDTDTMRDELVSEGAPASISEHVHNQVAFHHQLQGLVVWLEAWSCGGLVQVGHEHRAVEPERGTGNNTKLLLPRGHSPAVVVICWKMYRLSLFAAQD